MSAPGAPANEAWMTERAELATLAFYMATDGWDATEIARMIENPARYADLYALAKTEHQLDGLGDEDHEA